MLLGDIEHAQTLVVRRLRHPRALNLSREGVALVELSWWLGLTVRAEVLARANGHSALLVARVAREVRMAVAGGLS